MADVAMAISLIIEAVLDWLRDGRIIRERGTSKISSLNRALIGLLLVLASVDFAQMIFVAEANV